ncbi:MAG: CheR family methyltransferase [Chloroflexota bacterium]|nr:CheR family methyltransferase [Chloroflexota bacterium]
MPRHKNVAPEDPVTRQYSQQNPHDKRKPALKVVGIGASAGGLVALQGFFDTLPPDTGMAFVIITHMDPEHESLLPELLRLHTLMSVHQVQGKIAVQPNSIYVIAPNRRLIMTDHHLDVEDFDEPRGRRTPIDHFFRSLAHIHRNAVAVILSGGGTDGSVGVKDVKEQGGLLFVQHPDEAEHNSMPQAAIATGLADVVLPVRQLAQKLVIYQQNGLNLPINPDILTERDLDVVWRILFQVQAITGHDFSQYKQTTLLRRIERRMHLTDHTSLDSYLMHLRHTADEARMLFNDLLIGVTNFLRDPESWQTLAEEVIPHLFKNKEANQSIRVWTIGCSTGEEAYTLGMLLLEYAAKFYDCDDIYHSLAGRPLELQVFASDLDDAALAKAREGLYPEAIETDVSAERLKRFFTKEGHYYRVRRELRDMVLFTNHSVLRDPPFSRIDLISCRNLLIYLNRELQENVLDIFHYALKPEGYLFLGSAESANLVESLFHTVDKSHRLYQARPWRGQYPHIPSLPLTARASPHRGIQDIPIYTTQRVSQRRQTMASLHQEALEAYGPPSILIDEHHHILHVSETAGRYLLVRRGSLSSDLLELIRPELQFELRAALLQAFRLNKAILTSAVSVQFNGTSHRVVLSVRPRQTTNDRDISSLEAVSEETESEIDHVGHKVEPGPLPAGEWLAMVVFLEHEAEEAEGEFDLPPETDSETKSLGSNQALLKQLQAEVRQLRERARANIENYERSNEELKAANEELQSINEEYRSTAEELETSKEELQSLNEELQTVNTELKNKLDEISHINSDLENLMASTQIATLFLDRELHIRHFTPSMEQLFNILPGDRGRSITHLTHKLAYATLTEDAAQVLRTLVPIERDISSQSGRWFLARLRPYRTMDDRIDGIVLTFVDVTALKVTETALRDAKEYSEKIINTVHDGLLVLESDLSVQFANASFLQMFQVAESETVGMSVYQLGDGQWEIPRLHQLLEEMLPQSPILPDFRVEHDFEHIGQRIMLLNAQKLNHSDLILLVIKDITEQERLGEVAKEISALKERQHLARDLHDAVSQTLFASMSIAESTLRLYERNPTRSAEMLQQVITLNRAALAEMRTLLLELRPEAIVRSKLSSLLRQLVEAAQGRKSLEVEMKFEGSEETLPEKILIALYRIAQESINNILKHSEAKRFTLYLSQQPKKALLRITDDGRGFDMTLSSSGLGLVGMQERAREIGASLEVISQPGQGTTILVSWDNPA